ncbi:MAG: GNAT family N-acetyltransferase [Renibacterium sp.]|nr:GNAT family N-acetyltransferase [Renibacterium sp.]
MATSAGLAETATAVAVAVAPDDPRLDTLYQELAAEYSRRYGHPAEQAHRELVDYPAAEFRAPDGAFVLLLEQGQPVAGGAFRKYDRQTAELKRIWTHSAHRRRGLGQRVLAELEAEAARRGYLRIYLTTGPRQPEAKELYLAAGYLPQFDLAADPESIWHLPFRKELKP